MRRRRSLPPVHAIAAGTAILPGAPVGADHRDDGGAETECQRDQDVFEARAHRVADRHLSPQVAGDPGQQHDREVGDDHIDQSRHADLEDFGEQSPLQRHAAERQGDERAGRAQVAEQHQAAGAERHHQAPAGAGRTKGRQRSPSENQQWRDRARARSRCRR